MDSPTNTTQNPSTVLTVPGFKSHADLIISSLLSFPDPSPISIGWGFDLALDKALASASGDVSVQDCLVDRTLQRASLLLDSTKRCLRKRASAHNSNSWLLPRKLTVKVFSMLDTKSLMQAAACCTMFNKCAMNRLSYSHIDLTTATKQANNGVVCTMIHRAGKELRSLKLGRVARVDGSDSTPSLVNGAFLSPLSYNHGFLGSRLRSLRLYNIRKINYSSLIKILSVCPNLTDLRIVGLNGPFMHLFKTLTAKCRLIEHLVLLLEAYQLLNTKTGSPLIEFVTSSPNLTSLTLICFRLTDEVAWNLVEGSRKLKYLNLSRSPIITGRFLRDLGHSCKASPLKTLILRNCQYLEEKEVLELCNSLLKGNFKSIRHIDVSNNSGLVSDGGVRSYKPKFPLEKLKELRSDVTFVADFPLARSRKRYRVCDASDEEELREIEMMEAKNDEANGEKPREIEMLEAKNDGVNEDDDDDDEDDDDYTNDGEDEDDDDLDEDDYTNDGTGEEEDSGDDMVL